jgi:hypothetical protein
MITPDIFADTGVAAQTLSAQALSAQALSAQA